MDIQKQLEMWKHLNSEHHHFGCGHGPCICPADEYEGSDALIASLEAELAERNKTITALCAETSDSVQIQIKLAALEAKLFEARQAILSKGLQVAELKTMLAECNRAQQEAERQWKIHGQERYLLEQSRYTPGGELDQLTALRTELAECKVKLAEAEERLKPIGYHDVDEFYRDEVE